MRRIEETKAVFKNIPNEDIENARHIKEFILRHVNPEKHARDFYITIPDSEIQASNYKGEGCPESNYTYFFPPYLVTLACSSLCKAGFTSDRECERGMRKRCIRLCR